MQVRARGYNPNMPIFMCRWPNADLSFVSARSTEEAITLLDEWDNAESLELRRVQDFMVDFQLTDDGDLRLLSFGERSWDAIWDRAYPVLSEARLNAPANSAGELTSSGKKQIRAAVRAERERVKDSQKPKRADTEIGNQLQKRLGASAAFVNRCVKETATEMLNKLPSSSLKQ